MAKTLNERFAAADKATAMKENLNERFKAAEKNLALRFSTIDRKFSA